MLAGDKAFLQITSAAAPLRISASTPPRQVSSLDFLRSEKDDEAMRRIAKIAAGIVHICPERLACLLADYTNCCANWHMDRSRVSFSTTGGGQGGAAWGGGGHGCVLSTAQTSAAARGEVIAIRGAHFSVLINGTRFRN